MSAAGGPRITSDNMVMCLDAHDAKSYPGEPTTNYFGHLDEVTLGEFGQLGNLVDIFESYGLVAYTMSMDIKVNTAGGVYVYMQNGSYTKYSFVAISVSCTTEYQRFTFANLTPAGPTAAWTANTPTDHRAMLAMYTGYGSGINPTIRNIQIEKGTYATPFVGRTGKNMNRIQARPTSVNLMIHGNLGTGTSFYDSSPSNHTITANGNTTHQSSAKSKFGGGSIYFDGTGDYLSIPDSSDWAFGTSDFTIDFWFNPTGFSSYTGLIVQNPTTFGSTDSDHGLFIEVDYASTKLRLFIRPLTDPYSADMFTEISQTGIVAGTWYHVAVVRETGADKITMYLNGSSVGSSTWSGSTSYPDFATPLLIGVRNDQSDYFNGYMDEVRITKGTALWTRAFTPTRRRIGIGGSGGAAWMNRAARTSGSFAGERTTGANLVGGAATKAAHYADGQVIEPKSAAIISCDGTDDYVNCYDINEATGTLEFWMKTTFSGTYSYPFGKQKGTETLAMSMHNGNSPSHSGDFWVRQTDGGSSSVQTTAALNDGVWHQVVCMWGVGGLKIYVDGELNDTDAWEGHGNATSGDNNLGIGCILQSAGGSYFTPADYGIVRTWSTQLTSAQVKANFNAHRGRFGV